MKKKVFTARKFYLFTTIYYTTVESVVLMLHFQPYQHLSFNNVFLNWHFCKTYEYDKSLISASE